VQIIDLSLPIKNNATEPEPPRIKYLSHKKGGFLLGLAALVSKQGIIKNIFKYLSGSFRITSKDFPEGIGLAWEEIKANTHTGTHLDAPYHFGPTFNGKPAKTIDKVPLHWCFGNGVLLDMRHKKSGEVISLEDIISELKRINHHIQPFDIVLIMTGADKYWGRPEYLEVHPGVSPEVVIWLVDRGVKVIGTDAYGFDRPFKCMVEDYIRTKDNSYLWPAHFIGRVKEYVHIEKLTNLSAIPKPYGFKVACFPIKVEHASAAWARVVAIIDD
jgi:kynurenine formamidase